MVEERYLIAPWDNLVKGVTFSVFVLIISLMVVFSTKLDNLLLIVSILILYCSILLLPYFWMPQGYSIVGRKVIIKRFIGNVKFSIDEDPIRWNWTWWGGRLFGSGGLYGYYGFFVFKGIGRVRMYATNRNKLVLIKDKKGRKILLSPKEPEKFVQLLRI